MSHFLVTVLLDKQPISRENAEAMAGVLLAPYNENLEVKEYDHKCYCVGEKARNAAREKVDARSRFDAIHERYEKLGVSLWEEGKGTKEQVEAYNDEIDSAQADVEQEQHAAMMAHPDCDRADPDCTDCHGSGTFRSTRNPKARWDWFQVGGRWTGTFTAYEPEKDGANAETCFLCLGTGLRDDALGEQMRREDPEYKCNGCKGTGRAVKWPTGWKKYDGDMMPVSMLPRDFVPYALVTPDGEWHERATMGWWGCSSGMMRPEEWKRKVAEVLSASKACWAVACDCHI
jgi:hypothetical protein